MNSLEPAPYPADTRAKGWRFELDYERIKQSDTWALTPAELRPWLLMLWMTAWEQAPCGSLPSDSRLIAARIDMPLAQFEQVRAVLLRGWWAADDGRLYHDVITEHVLAMLAKRRHEADRSQKYRQASKAARDDERGVTVSSRVTHGGLQTDSGVIDGALHHEQRHQNQNQNQTEKNDEPIGSSVRDESRATLDSAGMQKGERLSMVTKDAIETYNADSITIQQGGRLPNVRLVTAERQRNVKRCLQTAQAICKQMFDTTVVTRKFWEMYWTTVANDPHCSGRAPGGKGHEHWTPDFEYLTRPAVMARLFDKAASAGPEVARA